VERVQPVGVSLVCLFTVLTAIGAWSIAMFFFSVWAQVGEPTTLALTLMGLIAAFGALFIADAVLIFLGMRAGYFLSMASWVLLILFDIWLVYWVRPSFGMFIPIIAYLILYPFFSFAYFSTERVKTYFSTAPKTMYHTVCSNCGKLFEVPFKPIKPMRCKECKKNDTNQTGHT
jgi:CxxC-x17-CxxC domain-containing protein